MKYLLIILGLALAMSSCSKEEMCGQDYEKSWKCQERIYVYDPSTGFDMAEYIILETGTFECNESNMDVFDRMLAKYNPNGNRYITLTWG